MNRDRYILQELCSVIQLNMKLVFRSKTVMAVCVIAGLIFLIVSGSLFSQSDKRSSIPIALVDQDKSYMSEQLIRDLKESDAVYVYETENGKAEDMLKNQQIKVWFELKPGMEKKIHEGNEKEVIVVHYLKENQGVTILSDIIAGQLMYQICLNKTSNEYKKLATTSPDFAEQNYQKFIAKLATNDLFAFRFQMEYVDNQHLIRNQAIHKNIKNDLLYQQAVLGVVGFLFSFVIMFLVYSMIVAHETVRKARLILTGISKIVFYIGQFVVAFVVMICLAGIYVVSMALTMKSQITMLVQLYGVFIQYCFVMIGIFLLMGIVVKKSSTFQMLGTCIVLGFGGVGTGGFLMGSQSGKLLNIFKIIPNYWFIKEFTDIIINGAI